MTTMAESAARSEETRLNSSHMSISYAVFCLKKKIHKINGYKMLNLIQPRQKNRIIEVRLLYVVGWFTFCNHYRKHVISLKGLIFFFFKVPATTEIYTLSLHDALPI